MSKTHWKISDNPNYLGAYSLLGNGDEQLTTIIEKVVSEKVKTAQGEESCRVVYLKGSKPMILNTTNAKVIEKIHNSPFIEDWVGKSITIYVERIRAFGESMDALRIRAVKPKVELPVLKEGSAEWNNVVKGVKNGFSVSDVKSKFKLSKELEKKLSEEVQNKE